MQSDKIGTGDRKGTICELILRPWPNFEFYHEPNFCLNFNNALSKCTDVHRARNLSFYSSFNSFHILLLPPISPWDGFFIYLSHCLKAYSNWLMQISIEIVDLVAVTLTPVKISHIGLDISNRVKYIIV